MKNRLLFILGALIILLIGVIGFELFLFQTKSPVPLTDVLTGKVHKTDLENKVKVEIGKETPVGEDYLVFAGILTEKNEDRIKVKGEGVKPPLALAKEMAFVIDKNTTFYEAVVQKGKEPLFVDKKFDDLQEGAKVFIRYQKSQTKNRGELIASRIGFQKNQK